MKYKKDLLEKQYKYRKYGRVEELIVKSNYPSIGLVEERKEIVNYIYLPKSYKSSTQNFPVLYYLHGYGGKASNIYRFKKILDKSIDKKIIKEVIVVGVCGSSEYIGTFYANSPITGMWEDYIIKDLIPYVNQNYKVINKKESRGIFGFSMGAFGAFNISLRYPDLFNALYMQSPGIMIDADFKKAFADWSNMKGVVKAYGASLVHNIDTFPYYQTPMFDNSLEDKVITEEWLHGFGKLGVKVEEYERKKDKLKGICIAYGKKEKFKWIIRGSKGLGKILTSKKIPHKLIGFSGGHDDVDKYLKGMILPFFNRYLGF